MSEYLTLHEEPGELRRPIIIMAFSGWNDAAESATTAARYLSQVWTSRPLASIDPEDFYHFGLSRPLFADGVAQETEAFLAHLQHPFDRVGKQFAFAVAVWRPVGFGGVYCVGFLALLGFVAHAPPVRPWRDVTDSGGAARFDRAVARPLG
jgi:hypothetical protein